MMTVLYLTFQMKQLLESSGNFGRGYIMNTSHYSCLIKMISPLNTCHLYLYQKIKAIYLSYSKSMTSNLIKNEITPNTLCSFTECFWYGKEVIAAAINPPIKPPTCAPMSIWGTKNPKTKLINKIKMTLFPIV